MNNVSPQSSLTATNDRQVDTTLDESFPASDPPSFTPATHVGAPERLAPPTFTPALPPLTRALARGLGWFSLALGATEVLAAEQLADRIGLEHRVSLLRAFGVREIGAGLGVLGSENPAGSLWARVAGDVLDVLLLTEGLRKPARIRKRSQRRTGALVALTAVVGVTALDVYTAISCSRARKRPLRAAAAK